MNDVNCIKLIELVPLFNILLCGGVWPSCTFYAFDLAFSIWMTVFTWLYIEDEISVLRPESNGESPSTPKSLFQRCSLTEAYRPESKIVSFFFLLLGVESESTTSFLFFLFFLIFFIFFLFFLSSAYLCLLISARILFEVLSEAKIPASPFPPCAIFPSYSRMNFA